MIKVVILCTAFGVLVLTGVGCLVAVFLVESARIGRGLLGVGLVDLLIAFGVMHQLVKIVRRPEAFFEAGFEAGQMATVSPMKNRR